MTVTASGLFKLDDRTEGIWQDHFHVIDEKLRALKYATLTPEKREVANQAQAAYDEAVELWENFPSRPFASRRFHAFQDLMGRANGLAGTAASKYDF